MDKNTENWKEFTLGNPQEEKPRRVDEKRRKRRRWRFFLLFIIVITVVTLSILWDRGEFDGLRRSVLYRRAEKDETGCAQLYHYPSDKSSCFAVLEGSLLNVSQNRMILLDETDTELYNAAVQYTAPALSAREDRALAYGVGSREMYMMSAKGLLWQKTMEGNVLSATVSEGGYTAVVYNKNGYKAAVSVYDPAGQEVFAFHSAERFLMIAAVSADSRSVAIISMGQDNNTFASYVTVYRLNGEQSVGVNVLSGNVVYDLGTVGDRFCVVAEDSLYFVDDEARIQATYHYGEEYLRRCVMTGHGYVALLLGHYKSGAQAHLLIIDEDGNELTVEAVDSEVLSLSAAGRYVGVLYSDALTVYDKNLTALATLTESSQGRAVMMRSDGSAIMAGSTYASLYLP